MQSKGYSYVVVVEYHEDSPFVRVIQAVSPEGAANKVMEPLRSHERKVLRLTVREVSMSGFSGDIQAQGPHWCFAPRVSLVLLHEPIEEN